MNCLRSGLGAATHKAPVDCPRGAIPCGWDNVSMIDRSICQGPASSKERSGGTPASGKWGRIGSARAAEPECLTACVGPIMRGFSSDGIPVSLMGGDKSGDKAVQLEACRAGSLRKSVVEAVGTALHSWCFVSKTWFDVGGDSD